jgi:hypothetical protein
VTLGDSRCARRPVRKRRSRRFLTTGQADDVVLVG